MGKTKKTIDVNDDYLDLVKRFPLRQIRNLTENRAAIDVLRELGIRADREGLSEGERDYMNALNHFIGEYEDKHYPLPPKATPLEMLKYLMEQHDMNPTDLGKLLGSGKSLASMILNGKRELSKANIRTLADHFKVNAGLFL